MLESLRKKKELNDLRRKEQERVDNAQKLNVTEIWRSKQQEPITDPKEPNYREKDMKEVDENFNNADDDSQFHLQKFNCSHIEGNQEALFSRSTFDEILPHESDFLNDEKISIVTPNSNEKRNIDFSSSKDSNQRPVRNIGSDSATPRKRIKTIPVEIDPCKNEELSTVTARSLETKFGTYSKSELLKYIINIKKMSRDNEQTDVEDLNEMTIMNVIKCAKYELFKRVQFIRHRSLLIEYEKKGSIGRFMLKKLKIPKERRKVFWNTYYPAVRKGIKSQRNIIHTCIRRKFLGK